MADQEPKELKQYEFTAQGQPPSNSSKNYSGKGQANYPNGDTFEGLYREGVRCGFGKYNYANGERYQGEFQNNQKHGIGRCFYNDKSQYYGQWHCGVKQGEGLFTYPNKDVYSGNWVKGLKHGQGTYVFNDTAVRLKGDWHEGRLVTGQWLFSNGTYFKGKFQNNKPVGQGEWVFSNGNTVKGKYEQLIVLPSDEDPHSLNIKLDFKQTAY